MQLEAKVAAFHHMEDCIIFPSCFDANGGLFEALLTYAAPLSLIRSSMMLEY